MPNPYHNYRQFHVNRLCYEGEQEGFDFSQMEAEETQKMEEDMEQMFADLDMDESFSASDENVQEAQQSAKQELSWGERMLVKFDMKSENLILAQNAFGDGDTTMAAKVYEEVSNMTREEAMEKYDLPSSTHAGSEALAAMYKLGMNPKDYADIKRAQRGEPTMQNMDLELSEADVQSIKDVLLGDSYSDKFVKAMTGQKRLEGYQRVLLSPANAIEGVATGVLRLPGTLVALADMSSELAKNSDLNAMGVKADVIMKIIDQYFSPAEKIAMVAQFVGEGLVSGGIGGAVSKLAKAPKIANTLNKVSKLKFAKVALASAKLGIKAGTSRAVGRGVSGYDKA